MVIYNITRLGAGRISFPFILIVRLLVKMDSDVKTPGQREPTSLTCSHIGQVCDAAALRMKGTRPT